MHMQTILTTHTFKGSEMPRVTIELPKHVHRKVAKGKTYYYYHPGRGTDRAVKPQRITGEPSDAAWWEQYRKLSGAEAQLVNANCFDELIKAWQASPKWGQLAASTQREWTRHCKRIAKTWGHLEVRGIEPKHVLGLQEAMAATPAEANNMLRCLSAMIKWSVPRRLSSRQPVQHDRKAEDRRGLRPLALGGRGTGGKGAETRSVARCGPCPVHRPEAGGRARYAP